MDKAPSHEKGDAGSNPAGGVKGSKNDPRRLSWSQTFLLNSGILSDIFILPFS